MNDERKKALQLMKTAKGQTEAIIRMIEDGRYCIDITNQMLAVSGLIKKANQAILKQHMEHCVVDAIKSGNENEQEQKIDEVLQVLSKIIDGK